MPQILVPSVFFFLAGIGWRKNLRWHPAVLYSLTWGIVYFLWSLDSLFDVIGLPSLSPKEWLLFGGAHFSFLLGTTISLRTAPPPHSVSFQVRRVLTVSLAFFILSLIGALAYWADVLQVISLGSLDELFRTWNYEATYGELAEFGGILGRLYVMPQVAVPLNIYFSQIIASSWVRKLLVVFSTVEIAFTIGPRRALLFRTLLLSLLLYGLTQRKNGVPTNRRFLWWSVGGTIALLVFFVNTQDMLNKTIDSGKFGGLLTAYYYIVGNIPALGVQLGLTNDHTFGATVFNVPARVLSKFVEIPSPDLSIPFVNIPFGFNTIPYIYYAYKDFGQIGTLLIPWLFALFATLCYSKSSSGFGWLYGYAYALLSIIFSFREFILITYDAWTSVLTAFIVGGFLEYKRTSGIDKRSGVKDDKEAGYANDRFLRNDTQFHNKNCSKSGRLFS